MVALFLRDKSWNRSERQAEQDYMSGMSKATSLD